MARIHDHRRTAPGGPGTGHADIKVGRKLGESNLLRIATILYIAAAIQPRRIQLDGLTALVGREGAMAFSGRSEFVVCP